MGLKCSVLGHAYGETTVERDREERGSEVVITIRELETCERCGDTRIVTENKEVTTIETADDSPDVTPEDAVAALDAAEEADASEDAEASGAEEPLVDDAESGTAVADDAVGGPSPDAVEDQGAEILDDEGDEDEAAVDDELADPTIEGEADGPDETSDQDDAVIIDDGPDDAEAAGRDEAETGEGGEEITGDDAGSDDADHTIDANEPSPFDTPDEDEADDDPLGEWPEETLKDTPEDDWTPSEDLEGSVGDVDPDADVDRELSTNSAVTVPDGEFYCEECGYTTLVEASSLRAGDFCPECRKGTLVHRPEE